MAICIDQEIGSIKSLHEIKKQFFIDWFMKMGSPMWMDTIFECSKTTGDVPKQTILLLNKPIGVIYCTVKNPQPEKLEKQ